MYQIWILNCMAPKPYKIYWMPPQELQLAVLFSGISTLLLQTPEIDQVVGMKISVFDEEPEPVDLSKWQWFSEVSIEFFGTEPAYFGVESSGDRDAFSFLANSCIPGS
ncbi:hypothetical protein cgR_1584 [Corynebacterium glutamicum R]|uniref:Aminotransferase-like plant mobile domain-containing protein n=2 Tax=Corynebacterium glutamicum TaxID=1718 RepID=A0AB72VB59_CORGB|nr:hypothetical protein cgR_1584 [Corynebacterium glutamicum R]